MEIDEYLEPIVKKDCKMSSQLSHYFIVISDLNRCKHFEKLPTILQSRNYVYYLIKHDKDQTEHVHAHLLLDLEHSILAKSLLNLLSVSLETNNENIQIMGVRNHTLCVQYLLHLNNIDKHRYDINDIQTNVDRELLENELNDIVKIKNQLDTNTLLKYIVVDKLNKFELMQNIGIGAYQHYRGTINDLYEYVRKR